MTKDAPGAKGPDPVEMDLDPSPAEQRTSRKHLRSSTDDEDLEWSSDESGRFDDAEEPEPEDYRSLSAKSAKRRRSNDWPLPDEAADYGHRNARQGNGGGLGANLASVYKVSPRASPRASVTSLRTKHGGVGTSISPRHRLGRRSRFVEATMSDSVSEKPPSIFMKEGKHVGAQNRGSGIFRFGKAIASAFNPFGGWGKSSPENADKSQIQKDALTQAEEAYAELKKAGFKGTNKGAYLQSQCMDQAHADQTWQAVMEKMGYGNAAGNPTLHCGEHESAGTPLRSPSKASKRSSFQDLRLGLPLLKSNDQASGAPTTYQERTSEDPETTGLRKQKSKKELSRQTKLLKKVNDLEDKLERARRELRELSGNEQRLPESTPESKRTSMDVDPGSYPRRFVPGALPTLPSERLLDQQALMSKSPEAQAAQPPAMPSMQGRGSVSLEEPEGSTSTPASSTVAESSKRRSKEPRPSSMGKDSSSRKRKSPIPEPVASRSPPESSPTDHIDIPLEYAQLIETGPLSPPRRQAKWQKFEAGDSPGSVERKRSSNMDHHATPHEIGSMHRRSPSAQSRRSSPGLNRSPNSKAVRSPPPLRSRRGRSNLRSVSPSNTPVLNSDPTSSNLFSSSPASDAQRLFYLQPHTHLDPDSTPRSSPSKSPHSRRRSRQGDGIPPVPPLPKELLSSAAKVHRSPTKEPVSRGEPAASALKTQSSSAQNRPPSGTEFSPWPVDIF